MSDPPASVHILEAGPREGFQFEPPGISTEQKIELIEALAEAGVPEIECASFVNPKVVPQMADGADVAQGINRRDGVIYGSMWLNEKGFRQARASGLDTAGSQGCSLAPLLLLCPTRKPQQGGQRKPCPAQCQWPCPRWPRTG